METFDLAVVDPPYGIGMDGGNVGYKGFNNFKKKNWDKQHLSNGSSDYVHLRTLANRSRVIKGCEVVQEPYR